MAQLPILRKPVPSSAVGTAAAGNGTGTGEGGGAAGTGTGTGNEGVVWEGYHVGCI